MHKMEIWRGLFVFLSQLREKLLSLRIGKLINSLQKVFYFLSLMCTFLMISFFSPFLNIKFVQKGLLTTVNANPHSLLTHFVSEMEERDEKEREIEGKSHYCTSSFYRNLLPVYLDLKDFDGAYWTLEKMISGGLRFLLSLSSFFRLNGLFSFFFQILSS